MSSHPLHFLNLAPVRNEDDPSQEYRPDDYARSVALQVISMLGGEGPLASQSEPNRESRRDAVDALAEVLRQAADFFRPGDWISTSENLPPVDDPSSEPSADVYTWDGDELQADRFSWSNYPSSAPMTRKPWFVKDPLLSVRYWRTRGYQTPIDS